MCRHHGQFFKKNIKKAFQLVKNLTKKNQVKMNTINDRNGNILTEEKEIMKRILFIIVQAPEQMEHNRRRIFKL